MVMNCDRYESPIGTLWLTGRKGVLTGLSFTEPAIHGMPGNFDDVKQWLDDYFRGIPRAIHFPMDPSGTPFQKLIWDLLMEIPFGETCSYGHLAKQAARLLGKENMSSQAVGQAAGRNPIAIIIPCHRCIGAGGKLTGYAYGLDRKQWLLCHEQKQEVTQCAMQNSDRLKQNG